MSKYELSIDELKARAANGDELAVIALEFRVKGTPAVIDVLRKLSKQNKVSSASTDSAMPKGRLLLRTRFHQNKLALCGNSQPAT